MQHTLHGAFAFTAIRVDSVSSGIERQTTCKTQEDISRG